MRVLVPSAVQSPSRVVYGSLRPSREPVALYAVAEQWASWPRPLQMPSHSCTLEVIFCTATLNLQLSWFRLQSARCPVHLSDTSLHLCFGSQPTSKPSELALQPPPAMAALTRMLHRRAAALVRCDSPHAPPPPPPLTALLHARSCTLPLYCHLARHNLVSPLCPPPTLPW